MIIMLLSILLAKLYCAPVKVFLLAGQSNMSGAALSADYPNWANPGNVTVMFAGEGAALKGPFDLSPGIANENSKYFGPEIGIAEVLGSYYNSDRILLVKLSWGGTALQGNSSDLVWLDGALYKNWFQPNLLAAITKLSDKSKYPSGFVISGIFWMQGEADACDQAKSSLSNYSNSLRLFLEGRLRVDLALDANLGTYLPAPFVYSQIRSHWPFAYQIQQEQLAAQYKLSNSKCIEVGKTAEVYSNPLGTPEYDEGLNLNHYNKSGSLAVGREMGAAMIRLINGSRISECRTSNAPQLMLLNN